MVHIFVTLAASGCARYVMNSVHDAISTSKLITFLFTFTDLISDENFMAIKANHP